MRAFFLSDVTPAECHWLSQNDGEGLSAAPQSRDNYLKYVQLSNPQETALVSWISRKELLCLCKQPECVFVPGESWGGSGYSLPFSWGQKWTDLLSGAVWAQQQLWHRVTSQVPVSHITSFTKRPAPRSTVHSLNTSPVHFPSSHHTTSQVTAIPASFRFSPPSYDVIV